MTICFARAPPPQNISGSKIFAFTLAEVLVTLGIIGVVAALTMPSLIANHKKNEASARLKKFYSVMSQAILFAENEHGPAGDWDKAEMDIADPDTGEYSDNDAINTEKFFNKYLKPYIIYLKTEKDSKTKLFKFILNDGSTVMLRNGSCTDFIFDYNGEKKPNVTGRDIYRFLLCPSGEKGRPGGKFITYRYDADNTREKKLLRCKSSPIYCSSLLEYDDWEFKNDYPFKP